MACKLTYKGQRFDTKQQLLKHLQMEGVLDQLMKTNLAKGYEIMSSEEIRNKLIELGVDADVAFQIIGEIGARNLDAFDEGNRLQNLEVAKQMQTEGVDSLKIRLATGWELGVDGKWRYEISNGKINKSFSLNNSYDDLIDKGVSEVSLRDFYINEDLYNAYPEIGNIKVKFFSDKGGLLDNFEMFFYRDTNNIYVNSLIYEDIREGYNASIFEKAFVHELQHAIQSFEGFARGGNTNSIRDRIKNAVGYFRGDDSKRNYEGRNDQEFRDSLEKLIKKELNIPTSSLLNVDNNFIEIFSDYFSKVIYNNLAGEVEARNVQSRINMSPEQRRNTLLSSTEEDVLRSDQIVQFQKQGVTLLPNGFYHNGKVYINQDLAELSTLVHEFSHSYNQLLKNEKPEFYKEGLNLIEKEGKQYIDFVKKNQPNLQGEALLEEALAQAVGDAGAKLIEAEKSTGLKQWLQKAWNKIKEMLGLSSYTIEQVRNMSLQEYTNAVAVDLLRGESLKWDDKGSFEKWKGNNRFVEGSEVQGVKTGESVVIQGYHGTTNEFYKFDASVKGNIEGHLGKVNYFTSDYQDANQNYLSEGADITGRIDRRQDELEDTLRYDYQSSEEGLDFQQIIDDFNITEEEVNTLYPSGQPEFIQAEEISRFLAEKELKGTEEKVLELYVKLNNPVVLGNGATWFDALEIDEVYLEEATQKIAEEYDITEEEAKNDYEWEIRDRATEKQGDSNKIVEALEEALDDNGYDSSLASDILGDNYYESEVDLDKLEQDLRKAELYDNYDGELASSQVIADFFKKLGFDGIILTDVAQRFRNMGLSDSTSHIHVFNEYNNQIKLSDGTNTTFTDSPDIRYNINATEQELQQIKNEAIANGTFMKAPNGKDTNLNERQWLQVRTKAFKENFFGDWQNDPENASKVVDENGEPMIVMHGTDWQFNEFVNRNSRINGFFFSDKMGIARTYGDRVVNSFLNIRNPYIVDAKGKRYTEDVEAKFKAKYPGEDESSININMDLDSIVDYVKNGKPSNSFIWVDNHLKYDGVFVKDIIDPQLTSSSEEVGNNYIAFNPNQIKSATDNVGTFSSETNDIRYQIGLEQQKIENKIKEFNHINNIGLKITVDQDKLKSVKEDIDSCSI